MTVYADLKHEHDIGPFETIPRRRDFSSPIPRESAGRSLSSHSRSYGMRSTFDIAPENTATLAAEIASSFYSYTFSQHTGALLKSRLKAIHRSMNTHVPSHHAPLSFAPLSVTQSSFAALNPNITPEMETKISSLLKVLRKKSAQQRASEFQQLTDQDYALLTSLTEPYIDAMPSTPTKTFRPPTLYRRASSMLQLNHSQDDLTRLSTPKMPDGLLSASPQSGSPISSSAISPPSPILGNDMVPSFVAALPNAYYRGIATPLQHLPTKQASKQAQFTTSSEYPYPIKTVNDVACNYMGKSQADAQMRSFAHFFPTNFRNWIRSKVERHVLEKVVSCGHLTEMNSRLVSIWVERSGPDALVWFVDEILTSANMISSSNDLFGISSNCTDHVYRIPSPTNSIVVQGDGHIWAPPVIGCAVLITPGLEIIDYNRDVLSLLIGTDQNLSGRPISQLVPKFDEFWLQIREQCQLPDGSMNPGVVIPEHKFRALAGISLENPSFISDTPSQIPGQSIELITEFGNLFIDIHLRIVDPNLISLWVSYSRQPDNHIFQESNDGIGGKRTPLLANSPPPTPFPSPGRQSPSSSDAGDYSELLNCKVGEFRREQNFDSFQELKLLGKGAYGEVRLVLVPSKKHKVVLKSIYKDKILVDTWSRDRLLGTIPNEIRVLNQLRSPEHPHIVQMIDFFEDTKCYHVEMVPCIGSGVMDLFDFIETKGDAASLPQLISIWSQIVSAVAHVHSLGIVHRDLKDENVIMDCKGSAKLIDFGSSAYVNQGPFDVFVGTIDYAAPEVLEGQLYEGISQDNWALGIMLYVMTMREPPFKTADDIVAAQFPEYLSIQDGDAAFCDKLIRSLLTRLPENRPTALQLLDLIKNEGYA